MCGLSKKYKLFIVVALIVLVVGMAILGFVGSNQTIDNKFGYEVEISIDQNVGNATDVLKSSADSYFDEKGIDIVKYAYQELDDGETLVYKFNKDVKLDKVDLETYIQDKLDTKVVDADKNAITAGTVEVSAEYSSVIGNDNFQFGWLLLSLGLAVVASFVYALFMGKLSGAVATVSSAVLSSLLFVALISIVRLPAYPIFGVAIAISAITSAILSIATVGALREELKNSNAKFATNELVEKVMKRECKKYLFSAIAVAVASVALSAFIVPNMMFVGGQLLVAGLCGVCVAYFTAPMLWIAIKGNKMA